MSVMVSVQSLYVKGLQSIEGVTDLTYAVEAFLTQKPIAFDSIWDLQPAWEAHTTEEKVIHNWKNVLTLTLLNYLARQPSKELNSHIPRLLREPWNEESQYLRVIVALVHSLTGLPVPEVSPQLLPGGAALIELKEYSPWLALPYSPYHAEFGTLLSLLAFLTEKEALKQTIERLAKWQLNMLDAHYLPFSGLFVQEKHGAFSSLLLWNYLFFKGAAVLLNNKTYEAIAQAQLEQLNQSAEKAPFPIPPLIPLIEKIFTKNKDEEVKLPSLPESIYDSSTALIGKRLNHYQTICTLHGGYTGLGCLRGRDTGIVTYGPQYLPLGECVGFGIEGNQLSDHGLRKSVLKQHAHGFSLKGCVRLVNQPKNVQTSALTQFKGIWIEIEQEWKERQLDIKTHFLGIDEWKSVAFSFFVNASKGSVETGQALVPKSFNRYAGPAAQVEFEGTDCLTISATGGFHSMEVIPLGGGDSFWGADFLVAYLLDPNQRHYQWQIQLSEKK